MKNDKVRVAKLYEKVFSTPVNSPEREQAYSTLSESDKTAVFNLERDCMLGRITRQGIAEMKQEGNETMTYAQYKKIVDNDCKGQLRELSQFAKENRNCTGSIVIDMGKKEKRNENHDSPKAHSKINHIALDRRENLYESSRI